VALSAVTVRATVAELPRASHEARCSHVHLVLHVDGCESGVLASVRYAGLAHDVFARADAARLRLGDQLTVFCAGFGIDDSGVRMRLFGVDHILFHEPRRSTAAPAARPSTSTEAHA
jgi:hypothetical protein